MNKQKTAEIICVGTELLLGNTINTNAVFIGKELAAIGIFSYYQTVIGDNTQRLKGVLELALERSDIIITTGGLGPTYDDLTKETVAELFNIELEIHQHSLARIHNYFKKFNRPLTPNNEKQALMPKGAIVFDNDNGTAPALAVEVKDVQGRNKIVILLPGPPREMQPLFEQQIKPYLLKFNPDVVMLSKMVNIFGMGESAVESKLFELMKSLNPTIAPYAKTGEIELRITAVGKNQEECAELITPVIAKITNIIGDVIYGIDAVSLEQTLVSKLQQCNLTIATAESCTGGLIGKRLTDISGASEVYLGGVVAYSNEVKQNLLNVKKETLEVFGAVSEQTACEMAKGVATVLNADIGVSTTGIAGPTGGSNDKPVGLVYIGIFNKKANKNFAIKYNLDRNYANKRDNIRTLAASNAINDVLREINLQK